MTEHENLPAKLAVQGLAATTEVRGSLVARGIAAIHGSKHSSLDSLERFGELNTNSIKFPVISTKGGRFYVNRDGVKRLILRQQKANQSDLDEPASYIDVVILNLQKAKTFYAGGYADGPEEKLICFSSNGVTPDVMAKLPQSKNCKLCQHNLWGTGSNDKGEATKGKACSDVQRLAIAAVDNLHAPMLLCIPPRSLRNLAEMSKLLSNEIIPLNGVVTRIAFDTDTNGVLTFKRVVDLDSNAFRKARSLMNDNLVLAMVGKPVQVGIYAASVTDAEALNLNQAAEEFASKAP